MSYFEFNPMGFLASLQQGNSQGRSSLNGRVGQDFLSEVMNRMGQNKSVREQTIPNAGYVDPTDVAPATESESDRIGRIFEGMIERLFPSEPATPPTTAGDIPAYGSGSVTSSIGGAASGGGAANTLSSRVVSSLGTGKSTSVGAAMGGFNPTTDFQGYGQEKEGGLNSMNQPGREQLGWGMINSILGRR